MAQGYRGFCGRWLPKGGHKYLENAHLIQSNMVMYSNSQSLLEQFSPDRSSVFGASSTFKGSRMSCFG